jgi:hypothetical protein
MFEGSPLPMWVHDPRTLAFREVNRMAVREYEFTREEFLRISGSRLGVTRPRPVDPLKMRLGCAPTTRSRTAGASDSKAITSTALAAMLDRVRSH